MKYAGATVTTQQPTLSLQLASLDTLNAVHKAQSIRRVFPHAGKHESKQEKYGLHLWYDIETRDTIQPHALAQAYRRDPNIQTAEPVPTVIYHNGEQESGTKSQDIQITPQDYTPADPDYPKQWHYNNTGKSGGTPRIDVGLKEAWSTTRGRAAVIVAVVDGGIDLNHEDLKDNLWTNLAELNGMPGVDDDGNGYIDDIHGFNFVAGYGYNPAITPAGPAPIIPTQHGTHVAGTIAARTDNGKGGAGVAGGDRYNPGVSLMSCQTIVDNSNAGAYITAAMEQ